MMSVYVIEGHVPFEALAMQLEVRPGTTRIAARGMPGGSAGGGHDPTARHDGIAFGGDTGDGDVFCQAAL